MHSNIVWTNGILFSLFRGIIMQTKDFSAKITSTLTLDEKDIFILTEFANRDLSVAAIKYLRQFHVMSLIHARQWQIQLFEELKDKK